MTTEARPDLGLKDTGCACCAPSSSVPVMQHGPARPTVVLVEGMTCAHCVQTVTNRLTALDGVDAASVELVAGTASRVTIRSAAEVDPSAMAAAITEAGYSIAKEIS